MILLRDCFNENCSLYIILIYFRTELEFGTGVAESLSLYHQAPYLVQTRK